MAFTPSTVDPAAWHRAHQMSEGLSLVLRCYVQGCLSNARWVLPPRLDESTRRHTVALCDAHALQLPHPINPFEGAV